MAFASSTPVFTYLTTPDASVRMITNVRTFTADLPKRLITFLERENLVEISRVTPKGGGVVGTEYKFLPGAYEYIIKYFKEVHQ